MLVKAFTLFLVAMAVLALFGRLRFPPLLKRKPTLEKPASCSKCGRYLIGPGGCDCVKPPAKKG